MINEIDAILNKIVELAVAANWSNIKTPAMPVKILTYPIPESLGHTDCPLMAFYQGNSSNPISENDQNLLMLPGDHSIVLDMLDWSMDSNKYAKKYTDDLMEKFFTLLGDPTNSAALIALGMRNPAIAGIEPDYSPGEGGWFSQPRVTLSFNLFV